MINLLLIELIFKFGSRTHGNSQKPMKFRVALAATSFGNISRNGSTGTADLASQAKLFFWGERRRSFINVKCKLMATLPY